jgi:hypothetical protein
VANNEGREHKRKRGKNLISFVVGVSPFISSTFFFAMFTAAFHIE